MADTERERRDRLAEHYYELPIKTRKWLEGLREDDIQTLNEAILFQEQARTVGRFSKWFLLTFVGIVVVLSTFGSALARLVLFFKTGRWPFDVG